MICRPILASLAAAVALCQPALSEIRPMARDLPPTQIAQSQSGFAAWREGFRAKARANGISDRTFNAAFQGVGVDPEVIRLDRRQAEFTKPIWEYLDTAVSANRINNGRGHARRLGRTLQSIEQRYGVDAEAVLAIWGWRRITAPSAAPTT